MQAIQVNKSFKVVVIGDASVGKSSLIHRAVDEEFWACAPTIGCNFRKYAAKSTFGEDATLEIWDTAGEERYQSIMSMYYRNAKAVIMIYDMSNPKSFMNVTQYWIEQVKTYCNDPLILLVGNKKDLIHDEHTKISIKTTARRWAQENDALHTDCSAKTDEGIDEMMSMLVDKLLERYQPAEPTGVKLEETGYSSYTSYCRC